ncbi:MAG: DUF4258 domain-containing protein [Chloroflexi bacterium]|nr:DUF4258 domain-containing protein [Chloroflexota bacterium]
MDQADTDRVRRSIVEGAYRLTGHAEREREADAISMAEVEQAFGSGTVELLEDYPDDPRGHSALFLGFTRGGRPLHAVVGMADPDVLILVTLYRPDPKLWHDWRRRA